MNHSVEPRPVLPQPSRAVLAAERRRAFARDIGRLLADLYAEGKISL